MPYLNDRGGNKGGGVDDLFQTRDAQGDVHWRNTYRYVCMYVWMYVSMYLYLLYMYEFMYV